MSAPAAPATYAFPTHRLRGRVADPAKTPLVLVLCGSLSPITRLHVQMLQLAREHVRARPDFELVAGYVSPVSSAYGKAGLETAEHRSVESGPACPVSPLVCVGVRVCVCVCVCVRAHVVWGRAGRERG